ncbi:MULTISPECIES: protein-glutamate methylesterase/protein-glutamine glutaminase [Clostridium]|uniref:protein-glutamate methylesterase/protein-glutamine glutaminase n=1 Tax=Clostridium TaxID=1485 RepID=UPI0004D58A63|nr:MULTISPECIES: chemotaxis response regulator protein-glutamate methylesterase [Clostridium]KEH88709.1 chemotaxis protein CheY [Clostridium novyi A str. 4540]KEH89027.1 chemotaxis protein CheY [Clostridium novyi A str. BKT29909]KEH94332.1 chemotaxis protein CheY [Clostridium botulinum C/D str. It1]KEH95029.1 chemotaxis protein CheY [Clostridium novyi A str. GD211209]
MEKIKVIVVDDSALMRKIISDMINMQPDMEVICTARNGEDLIKKLETEKPDVITLDIEMPKMNGMETLHEMKIKKYKIPTIMLSSVSKEGTKLTMECLHNGAFDFIAKPSGAISLDIEKVGDELVSKIRVSKSKNNFKIKRNIDKSALSKTKIRRMPSKVGTSNIEAVVIGASTGGPKALYKVITELPEKLGVPIFVVQHMPVGFTKAFADRLDANSKIKVVEASEGDIIKKDVVYVAKGGSHMEITKDKKIHLSEEPPIWGVRPAVDKLFISAAKVYGSHVLSVVLTGMGRDGAEGTKVIKDLGGMTISEDKDTCTIYGMPKAAFETGKVDYVLPIYEISEAIAKNTIGSGR